MTAFILRLWRQGAHTALIAQTVKLSEAEVYRIIAADQDRRHAARQGRAA